MAESLETRSQLQGLGGGPEPGGLGTWAPKLPATNASSAQVTARTDVAALTPSSMLIQGKTSREGEQQGMWMRS